MRLFISYARVDKPYCIQIAETLDIHKVWYDQRLYAGQQWWKEILQRLEWCEGFVYLLSPESVASEYCRKEFEIARASGRYIFPVLIHDQTRIPKELKHIQYADLSNGLTPDAVKTLLNSIHLSERQDEESRGSYNPIPDTPEPVVDEIDLADVITEAAEAMESGKFDHAVFLLKQTQEHHALSRFIDLSVMLTEAEIALERQTYVRDAEREYRPIVELVKRQATRKLGCSAFHAYRQDFGDYDPDNLAKICDAQPRRERPSRSIKPDFTLPLLEWCEVHEGVLLSSANGRKSRREELGYVEHFNISKYPVTNAQFQKFIDDREGYSQLCWWDYSPEARQWREENPEPKASRFKGDNRPRENVTWYEAMAFCRWLSDKTGLNITLPTTRQWRRAAQGDDGRLFPWGNKFDPEMANTRESKIRMTTLVMRYDKSASPFGVYDMAGNLWEWCLDAGDNDSASQESEDVRAIYGGSFISDYKRAQTNFHFNLSPEYFYATIGFRMVWTLF